MNKFLRLTFVAAFAVVSSFSFAQTEAVFDFIPANNYELFGLAGQSTQSSHDGDITEDKTATKGNVTLTVSPSGVSTANRVWKSTLRMYGGTLTIKSAQDDITKIVFAISFDNWTSENSVNVGTLTPSEETHGTSTYKFQNWAGNAKEVILTLGGTKPKAYLRSVTVTTTSATGIEKVETIDLNADAPLYNLAGQRVSADYKGVVIQNGKKFVQK